MTKLICPICEEEYEDYHERMSDDFCLIENEYGEYYCYACGNDELEELEENGKN